MKQNLSSKHTYLQNTGLPFKHPWGLNERFEIYDECYGGRGKSSGKHGFSVCYSFHDGDHGSNGGSDWVRGGDIYRECGGRDEITGCQNRRHGRHYQLPRGGHCEHGGRNRWIMDSQGKGQVKGTLGA